MNFLFFLSITIISTEFNLTNPSHYTWSNGETRDGAELTASHANWRYIDYSSAVSAAREHWISICRVVFVIVSLISCTFALRIAEYGGSTCTRHERPYRVEDLSYKIIGERSWKRRPRHCHRGRRDPGPERKIIVTNDRPSILSYKMSIFEVYLSLAFSPLYNTLQWKKTYPIRKGPFSEIGSRRQFHAKSERRIYGTINYNNPSDKLRIAAFSVRPDWLKFRWETAGMCRIASKSYGENVMHGGEIRLKKSQVVNSLNVFTHLVQLHCL